MTAVSLEASKAKIARRVIEVFEYFGSNHQRVTVMDIARRYNWPQYVIEALRLKARWYNGGFEITSQLGAVVAAVAPSARARPVTCFVFAPSMRPRHKRGRRITPACAGARRGRDAMALAIQRLLAGQLDRAIRDAACKALRPYA